MKEDEESLRELFESPLTKRGWTLQKAYCLLAFCGTAQNRYTGKSHGFQSADEFPSGL